MTVGRGRGMLPVSAATSIWPERLDPRAVTGLAAAADAMRTPRAWSLARFRWLPRVPIQRARRAAGG
jgi:hypothetical protein